MNELGTDAPDSSNALATGHPYRSDGPRAPSGLRTTPSPAPMRPKELAALVAVLATIDIALWHGGSAAIGGYGIAWIFLTVPPLLLASARIWRVSKRLGAVAVLLAAVVARCVYAPTGLTVWSGFALIFASTLLIRAPKTFVPEIFASAVAAIGKLPSRSLAAVRGFARLTRGTRFGRVDLAPIWVPIAICIPFVAIFGLANPIVADALATAWGTIARLALPSPMRVFTWLVALVLCVVWLRPAIARATGSEDAESKEDIAPGSLATARNALIPLNVLFAGFNALDLRYLWIGARSPLLQAKQYAHEGAFWLTVALALVTVVLGVLFRGPLAHDPRARVTRMLAYVWTAQAFVLALGTYGRIALHIGRSGLSDLRIVGIVGTTLVVVGLGMVAHKLRVRRSGVWLLRRQLDVLSVAIVLYAVAPTHWVSARVNVSRIQSGEAAPLLHMPAQAQEVESSTQLIPLLRHRDRRVRDGIAVLLEAERSALRNRLLSRGSWFERDLRTSRALAELDAVGAEISTIARGADRRRSTQELFDLSFGNRDSL